MSETWIVGGVYHGHQINNGRVNWRKRLNGWRKIYKWHDDRPAIIRNLRTRYDGGSTNRKVPPDWSREIASAYPYNITEKFKCSPKVLDGAQYRNL